MPLAVTLTRDGERVVARCEETGRVAAGQSRAEALGALRAALADDLSGRSGGRAEDLERALFVVADETDPCAPSARPPPSPRYRRVLVGTDLDPAASPVLADAVGPFLDATTRLALCHVRWNPERYLDGSSRNEASRELDEASRRRFAEWSSSFLPSHERELLNEAAPRPVEGIAQAVARWGAELVAVVASASGGVGRALFGAVADRVVRDAHVDVLVARPSPPSGVVLVATDLSDPSFAAVVAGAEAAARRAGRLVVVHVADGARPFYARHGDSAPYRERVDARSWIHHALGRIDAKGQVEILEGAAAESITGQAAVLGAQLLVVASRGRGGVSRWLFGSVAEKVARSAGCSVLVARR